MRSKKHIVKEAEAEKDKVIAELSAQITNNENLKNLAVSEVETRYN